MHAGLTTMPGGYQHNSRLTGAWGIGVNLSGISDHEPLARIAVPGGYQVFVVD